MININRILVPCDFSDFSARAIEHARALAHWYDAEITVLFAMPLLTSVEALPVGLGPVAARPVSIEAVRAELEKFVASAGHDGVSCDCVVAEGNPVDQILNRARLLPADLLVMGTHGRSGFERWVLGSVTEKVLRKARAPVLTVSHHTLQMPEGGRPPFSRILCATDFSESSLRALEYALSLAQEGYAQISLLHVIESLPDARPLPPGFDLKLYRDTIEEETAERLRTAVPANAPDWCRPQTRLTHGKAHEEILRVAQEERSNLIVMGVQGRTALDLMLFGSNTGHVIRGSTCPVLTIC